MGGNDVDIHCIRGADDALIVRNAAITKAKIFGLEDNQPECLMGGIYRCAAISLLSAEARFAQIIYLCAVRDGALANGHPQTKHRTANRGIRSCACLADPRPEGAVLSAGDRIFVVKRGV